MHELSLCESVMQILEDNARLKGYNRVKTLWLEIGELSCVEADALRFSFEVVSRGTLAEGATLEIITVPGLAWCLPCGKHVAVKQRFDACPVCGNFPLQVSGGDEMKIKELEVD